MILLSTALAAVSGGADIRPWTVEGRIALPEEAVIVRIVVYVLHVAPWSVLVLATSTFAPLIILP